MTFATARYENGAPIELLNYGDIERGRTCVTIITTTDTFCSCDGHEADHADGTCTCSQGSSETVVELFCYGEVGPGGGGGGGSTGSGEGSGGGGSSGSGTGEVGTGGGSGRSIYPGDSNCSIICPSGTEEWNCECKEVCDGGRARDEYGNCKFDCETTAEDLKAVFPGTNDNRLEEVATYINEYAREFGIDTEAELQHFLAQAGHESKDPPNNLDAFEGLGENLNYAISVLGVSEFVDFFNPSNDPLKDPSKMNPNLFKRADNPLRVDKAKLANLVYNDNKRKSKNKLGNVNHSDGYKYRGRGIFQLTGRYNYTQFNTYYQANYDASIDLVANPQLVQTNTKIAVISALWFFKTNVLNKMAISEFTNVNHVSKLVNGGRKGRKERKDLLEEKIIGLVNCK